MEDNQLYQFSLVNALMDGVCETGVPVSKFLEKGNQGLGTFVRMDGELISLDGKVYQLRPEGRVRVADPADQIPYGMTTNFMPQATKQVTLEDKTALDRALSDFNPRSANLFLTYRITGHFDMIKARTVRGQEYKGQPLAELGKKQHVQTYENIEATVVGFRTPQSWQGFVVAGHHLHFIDKDCKAGGHVLELCASSVSMSMAIASNIHVELPTSEEFNNAKLTMDDEGIKSVEN